MKQTRKYLQKSLGMVVLLLALLQLVPALGQEWSLGPVRFAESKKNIFLKAGMVGASSYSTTFLESIGGVDFTLIGQRKVADTIEYNVHYIESRQDGQRLLVIAGSDTIFPTLYDWQLVPIAKYANDTSTAVVSVYGENANKLGYTSKQVNNPDQILFHEAFKDELLGIRLLQVDLILSNPIFNWSMMRLDGQIIIGPGEQRYADDLELLSAEYACLLRTYLLSTGDSQYFSWVFSDIRNPVEFQFEDNELLLNGFPYYYFWKFHDGVPVFNKHYTDQFREEVGPTFILLNPYVFDAAINTSWYSSFFRFVKMNSPDNWTAFMNAIQKSSYRSTIKTPGSYKD